MINNDVIYIPSDECPRCRQPKLNTHTEPQIKKRGILPLPVRRWGPEITCRMDRTDYDTRAIGKQYYPVKRARGHYLPSARKRDSLYTYPQHLHLHCLWLYVRISQVPTAKNKALANANLNCSASTLQLILFLFSRIRHDTVENATKRNNFISKTEISGWKN